MKKFSTYDAIVLSIKTCLDHPRLFFLMTLAFFGALIATMLFVAIFLGLINTAFILEFKNVIYGTLRNPNYLSNGLKPLFMSLKPFPLFLVMLFFSYVIFSLLGGLVQISFDIYDTGMSSVKKLFSCFNKGLKLLVSFFLVLCIVIPGIFLFIVPGFYLIIRFLFCFYFIVDKNKGIIDSLKSSWKITQGHEWNLFGLGILVMTINGLLNVAPISYLIFFPLTILAYVHVYRQLEGPGQTTLPPMA